MSTIINVSSAAELQSALDRATGGETLLLAPGNYGAFDDYTFYFTDYVTLKSVDPEDPARFDGAVPLEESSYVRFEDLVFGEPGSADDPATSQQDVASDATDTQSSDPASDSGGSDDTGTSGSTDGGDESSAIQSSSGDASVSSSSEQGGDPEGDTSQTADASTGAAATSENTTTTNVTSDESLNTSSLTSTPNTETSETKSVSYDTSGGTGESGGTVDQQYVASTDLSGATATSSESTTIHVSTAAELQSALANATGGETILLASGHYGQLQLFDHNYSDYVTIKSADADNPAEFGFMRVNDSSYMRFEDLKFSGVPVTGGTAGVNFHNDHHIQFYNNHIDGGDTGLKAGAVRHFEVVGNSVDNVGEQSYKFFGIHDFLIENNEGAKAHFPEPESHQDFIQFAGSSSNGVVRGNVFLPDYHGSKIIQGIFLDNGTYSNILIEQNLIYNTGSNGIGTGATYVGSNVVANYNTVLTVPGFGYHTSHITLPGTGNISNAGAQLNLQYDDPSAPNHYNSVYQNATAGMGASIEDFRPVPGGPGDVGSGLGAYERIAELLNEGGVPGNTAPNAGDDTTSTMEDEAVTVSEQDLLSNDTDPDGDALTIVAVNGGPDGTAVLNADGSITFTPDENFNGTATFSYTVSDGNGRTDTANVTVDVAATADAPTAQDDVVYSSPDQSTVINVLGNDDDPDGDVLQVTDVSQGANGTVTINADGTLTYTPNSGQLSLSALSSAQSTQSSETPETDTFTYTVSDGNGGTDVATVTVTMGSLPAPVFDLGGTHEFSGSSADVINLPHEASFEVEQATIAFSFTADSVSGRQGLLTKDAYSYDGGGNHLAIYIENGVLKARFQDGQSQSVLSFGGVNTGDEYEVAATFGPGGVQLYVDGELVGSNSGLLMSWTGNQEYMQIGGLGWGSQTGQGDFSYPFAGEIADVQIFSEVLDAAQIESLTSGPAPTNAAPVAADDEVSVAEDGSVTFQPGANDTDGDGDTVVASSIASAPENGTAVVNPDGTVTYTPNSDYNGSDSFEVTVSDGNGGFDTSTVNVEVTPSNDGPVAADDAVEVVEDGSVTFQPGANDTDGDGDAVVASSIASAPANGTAVVNPDGTVTYTPNSDFSGSDSFEVTVSDGNGGFDTSTVNVDVTPSNDGPVAADDAVEVAEDGSVTFQPGANDADLDGDMVVASEIASAPANGTAVVNPDGTVTYTPNADFNGTDSFEVTVSDGNGGFDTSTVSVEVTPVNDGPQAVDDDLTVAEDGSLTFQPGANDTDLDGDLVRGSSIAASPSNGKAIVNPDGTVTYTPNPDFSGSDSFDIAVTDGNGGFDISSVEVTVTPAADAPVAADDAVETQSGAPVVIAALDNDTDPDGDALQVTGVSQGANGSVVINDDGTLTYTPADGFEGTDSFTYVVSDGNGGSDTATVTVDVAAPSELTPVLDLAGPHQFSGSSGDVINLPHDAVYETSDATIAFSFNAESVSGKQGLVSKDARGYSGDGNHVSIYIDKGVLKARFQDGQSDTTLVYGGLQSGRDYEIAATFGSNGVQLYVNGELVGSNSGHVMSWSANHEYLQIGALGWSSRSEDGSFRLPFTGEISDIQIYNEVLDEAQIQVLATTPEPENIAPEAADDAAATQPGETVVISVLDNDLDPEGEPLQVVEAGQGANGSVTVNDDGTLSYTPNAGFEGTDSFSYTVSDGKGGTDTATVSIVVSAAPKPVFDLTGTHEFRGGDGDVINLAHQDVFEVDQATVAFSFTADRVSGKNGLLSKDASGYSGGGNHLAIYIEDGVLKARFQDGQSDSVLIFGGVKTGREYDVAATFGPDGVKLYVDGELAGSNSGLIMSWEGNQEYLQIGGLGWASKTGADDFRHPFDGRISDVEIYDQALEAPQVELLANGTMPSSAFSVSSDDAVLDTGAEAESVLPAVTNDAVLEPVLAADPAEAATPANTVTGTDGNDKLSGTSDADLLEGGDGDDLLFGRSGEDHLVGGAGNDTLRAGAGDDVMSGGAGDDLHFGDLGFDTIVFDGNVSEFTFSVAEDGSMIVDHTAGDGHEGRDTVKSGVEALEFNGVTLNLDDIFSAMGPDGTFSGEDMIL